MEPPTAVPSINKIKARMGHTKTCGSSGSHPDNLRQLKVQRQPYTHGQYSDLSNICMDKFLSVIIIPHKALMWQ